MKTLLLATLTTMTVAAHAEFDKCPHMVMAKTGTIIVVPAYSAKVAYMFDDTEKEAYANVDWKLDRAKTSTCIEELKLANPGKKVEFPYTNMPEFFVKPYKAKKAVEMRAYLESPQIYYGQSYMIPVEYSGKAEILKGIRENTKLVSFYGDFFYKYEEEVRKLGGYIPCTVNEQNGVPALHNRLGEIMGIIKDHQDEKVNRDEVLEDFMGSCVEIKDAASSSLSGFSKKVKLKKGNVPYNVTGFELNKGALPAFTDSESSYIEY